MGVFRYMSLQQCEAWFAAYTADMLESAGAGSVISISGGGESETRADAGVRARRADAKACMRRMHQLDPTKYPAIPNSLQPDFSAITL